MKSILCRVADRVSFALEEIDVDTSPVLQEKYGNEVPVLFINGRKAFKYRIDSAQFVRQLQHVQRAEQPTWKTWPWKKRD